MEEKIMAIHRKSRRVDGTSRPRGPASGVTRRVTAGALALLIGVGIVPSVLAPAVSAAPAGAGFTVTASDLAFILKQIKISEAHVANTTSETGPCGALVGTGPDQIPSPLVSLGLRTVDGSCNNLQPGQETFGAADQTFPRLTTPVFKSAEDSPPAFGPSQARRRTRRRRATFSTPSPA